MRTSPSPPPPLTCEALTTFLHQGVPLTRAMALRVVVAEPNRVCIEAPLTPNLNHHGSAFGGSLATLSIVTGWTLLHLRLISDELSADLVVHRANLTFSTPVTSVLRAETQLPEAIWTEASARLRRGQNARIALSTQIHAEGQAAVQLDAEYVAIAPRPASDPA